MDLSAGFIFNLLFISLKFSFRPGMNLFNKSQLEEDEEKVTRETAAYNRLDAVLRVTKPLCEKQIQPIDNNDEQDDNQSIKTG